MEPDLPYVCDLMAACNVSTLVNLDGRWGQELERNLDRYDRAFPDRFATFCHLDWELLAAEGHAGSLVRSLERSAAAGARGLKVWKDLGLGVTMNDRLLLPDDPLLEPIWEAAGALGLPVLIHVADPLAYFDPVDRMNERRTELLLHPDRSLAGHTRAWFMRLIAALEGVVARHGSTTFIGAHVGCFVEDLHWVERMLERYANFHIDLAARVTELGRQAHVAADLIERHPDRVLLGTDAFPLRAASYHAYFGLLEGEGEVGFALSDDALEKVYRSNARSILGVPGSNTRPMYLAPSSGLTQGGISQAVRKERVQRGPAMRAREMS